MNISYIVNSRLPTEKAHGFQIAKMCEQFSGLGVGVKLFFPSRKNFIKEDLHTFYNVKNNFSIKQIRSLDLVQYNRFLGRFAFYIQGMLFLMSLFFLRVDKNDLVYTRDAEIAWFYKARGYKVFYEAHNWPESKTWLYKFFLKNIDLIICNSKGTECKFKENDFKRTITAPNGVDLEKFDIKKSKNELRFELDLPIDKKIIMYVGHLYDWKGVDVVIEVAGKMRKREDVTFVFVGGTTKDLKKYQKITEISGLKNILLLGHKKKEKIPAYLKSADILLLPNIPISTESVNYTSPIKMFEYMASKRPIIASDLPSIREILNDDNALLVRAGDAVALLRALEDFLEDPKLFIHRSGQAFVDVQGLTWEARSDKILKKIYYDQH